MMVSKKLEDVPKKMDFEHKNSTFGPKKGHFVKSGP